MSYKDDEEFSGEVVDINEEDVDIIEGEEDIEDALLDDDLLIDEEDDYFADEDEEELDDFAGIDGSEYN